MKTTLETAGLQYNKHIITTTVFIMVSSGCEPSSAISDMCSRIIIEWKSPSFTLKQHWARNLEGVIERPLFDSSPSLRLTPSSCGSLFTAGPDGVVWGEKCPVLMLRDWLSGPKQILSILHVNLFPFASDEKKKNCFLQEVCNKSLAIDDNGICACVCHLRKSNSGGVSTDLFVY